MYIVPTPQYMTFLGRSYSVNALTVSCDTLESIRWEIVFFGLDIKASAENVNLFLYEDPNLKDEEYEIIADEGGIRIVYSTLCGRFRAFATLKQLLDQAKNGQMQCLRIHDYPDIPVRGMMLVVHSKCIYNIDTLHYLIDRMAELKYNSLQLYFDTFVFEYDCFKKYLEGKVFYTKEEIKALDAYCAERHIEMVANVETFGHMQELLATEEFKHLAITRDKGVPFSLNPMLDESFDVVKNILDDLLPYYSSGTVHIGMDETYGLGENETKAYCDAFGSGRVFAEFLTKINNYVKEKHFKRSMIWSDMAVKHPESLDHISKDVIMVDWGYEPGHKFGENALLYKKYGFDFYVAPGTQAWASFTGRTDVMVQNIHFAAEAARSYGGKGFLLTEWNEIRTTTISMLPYCLGGAFSWNSGYAKTISEADNESNCMFRNKVVNDVLAYFDQYILGCKGESCAELIYRMGNCCMYEQPDSSAVWNGTLLYKQFMGVDLDDYARLSDAKLKRMIRYMQEIKEELADKVLERDTSGVIMREILFACDISIYAAAYLLQDKNANSGTFALPEKDALVDAYEYLNTMHCHTAVESPIVTRLNNIQ